MTSSYKQVLVHLDATQTAPARLAAGRRIAEEHGAAFAALYAVAPVFVEVPEMPALSPGLVRNLEEVDNERRARTRTAFDRAMATPGPVASWSETNEVPLIGAFAQQALYADLLVLGQRDASDPHASALPPDFNEAVILGSGKPALIVPYVGWSKGIGDTAVIAWKPTSEAARAVAAAMPLLQRARRVHVLAWGAPERPAVTGPTLDFDSYLRLHGVEPTWHREDEEPVAAGELLLSRAFDLDADLLVMGCYGHSRARELVLGGASRTVLRSMTLPVLMSH